MNWRSPHGETLLMRAVAAVPHDRPAPVVATLLEAGMDANAVDKRRRTALMRAAARGALLAVKELLRAGANPFMTDGFGHTAVDWGRKAKDAAAGFACAEAVQDRMEEMFEADRAETAER